jgi:hypothetical protein
VHRELDDLDDVDTTIKGVISLGGTVTTGSGAKSVTSSNNDIPLAIRSVENLKLCVYYLKHMERVQRKPVVNTNLALVCSYRDQQRHEVSFKKTVEEPVINDKDWHRTLETIKEYYLDSQYGGTGATLDYVVRPHIAVKPEAKDPADGYVTMYQEMTTRAPHTG